MLRALGWTSVGLILWSMAGVGALFGGLYYFGRGLPDYQQLATYQPPTMTRVHAGDGRVLAEYASERRLFVPVGEMPKLVVNAFLAAEDKNFYSHPGVDFMGFLRAVVTNVTSFGQNRRPVGGSTITQQVAKNFLLTNEVSIERKIREAILAFRIERAISKDRILELYMNEIYLGQGSYGVAAAALNYFAKPLDQLTLAEAAYLAALPKAPNNYHPVRHAEAARGRRDWVIGRMLDDGIIGDDAAALATSLPIIVQTRDTAETIQADYFSEEVRRQLLARYGEAGLYRGGLSVRTTLDTRLQSIADRVLREGLVAYDRRHGWRGAITTIAVDVPEWTQLLARVTPPPGLGLWRLAAVRGFQDGGADIGFADGSVGHIPAAELQWARAYRDGQRIGPAVRQATDVLGLGDVVAAEPVETKPAADGRPRPRAYGLRQIPEIAGAAVALDPHTGRVLAMSGGYSYEISQFNRATQAKRQPGSSFKPFVYMAALDSGFTPSSLVLDAPVVIDQGPGLGKWKPANINNNFLGAVPMRMGIEQSRNLMTIRLAQNIGIEKVADYAVRFGVVDKMPTYLSASLGAVETTLLDLSSAYAMIVNGGMRITPSLIDRVQDRNGKTIFRHDGRPCIGCRVEWWSDDQPPLVPDFRERVVNPATAYQMVSMLQGVVERGTGRRIADLHRPLAGKTGTTNDYQDAWFVGFSPDLVFGVFVGFDTPQPMGNTETGSSVSVPIFRAFMAEALKDKPAIPFRIPPGIRMTRVNAATGLVARPGDTNIILEAFKPGTEPTVPGVVLDGPSSIAIPGAGIGGLY
ncbi:MAG: penicillin-binding protein 1A [Rhodospirillaceae bacterium]|nr:penicillin-binding protein 1A [Rhodospirillaceae bacterium]